MEASITSARKNPLLERTELELKLEHIGEATPSEEDVVKRIAAEKDFETDNIEIDGIYTGFGKNVSVAHLRVKGDIELEEDELVDEETVEAPETETEEDKDAGDADEETEEEEVDYEEIVSGTIKDAKEALQELEQPDYNAALEAEKDNKNRTTFTDWLENQL